MEPQVIHTDKYGDLHVIQSYHEAPRLIHLLENGAYVSDTGRPIEDEQEGREGIPPDFLLPFLEWLKHKDDAQEGQARKILVMPNNRMAFEDGTPVENIQDIIAFFEPGHFREAALISFASKLKEDKEGKAPPKVEKPKPAARKTSKGKKSQGHKRASKPAPPVTGEQPAAM